MARWVAVALFAAAVGVAAAPAPAASQPPVEAVSEKLIPLERYITPKGQTLARAHQPQLVQFSEHIWGCLPWLDVQKHSIGFRAAEGRARRRPLPLDRGSSFPRRKIRSSPRMPQTRRMSAMFSRYGVDLLRRMTSVHDVLADSNVHGFSVVLSWLKPGTSRPGAQPVNETLALFIDKTTGLDFLAAADSPRGLRSAACGSPCFDGQTDLGPQVLEIWDDDFAATFKLPELRAARRRHLLTPAPGSSPDSPAPTAPPRA